MGKFIFFGICVLGLPKSEDDVHTTFTLQKKKKKAKHAPSPSGDSFDSQVRRMLSLSRLLTSADCGQDLGSVPRAAATPGWGPALQASQLGGKEHMEKFQSILALVLSPG